MEFLSTFVNVERSRLYKDYVCVCVASSLRWHCFVSANAVSKRTRQGNTTTQVEVTLLTEPNELHSEIMGLRESQGIQGSNVIQLLVSTVAYGNIEESRALI